MTDEELKEIEASFFTNPGKLDQNVAALIAEIRRLREALAEVARLRPRGHR